MNQVNKIAVLLDEMILMNIIEFVFQNFWTFAGTVIIVSIIGETIIKSFKAIFRMPDIDIDEDSIAKKVMKLIIEKREELDK